MWTTSNPVVFVAEDCCRCVDGGRDGGPPSRMVGVRSCERRRQHTGEPVVVGYDVGPDTQSSLTPAAGILQTAEQGGKHNSVQGDREEMRGRATELHSPRVVMIPRPTAAFRALVRVTVAQVSSDALLRDLRR